MSTIYVWDNGPFRELFRSFYPTVFKTLWSQFDELIADGRIVSTREIKRELDDYNFPNLNDWCSQNTSVFATPNAEEAAYLAKIFAVPHFQQAIEMQKLQKGGKHGDAFVIAKAGVCGGTVVTFEKHKPNSTKIPNICEHFGLHCMSLQEFMENEGWEF